MRRQCARPGCSAVATATFTFDSAQQTVWLDTAGDDGARAGELCTRHARVLAPPRGWNVVDRRAIAAAPPAPAVAPTVEVLVVEPVPTREPAADPAAPAASRATPSAATAAAAWHPRFERGDTLGGVLDARTPLLSRAFDNVRAG
jgi:hypothetical protein